MSVSHPRSIRLFASILFLALLVLVASCGDQPGADGPTAPSTDAPVNSSFSVVAGQVPDLGPAIEAADVHTPGLMARPGVVGTAVGLDAQGRPSVRIFVVDESVRGLPNQLDGVPVSVEVTGFFVARSDETARARPAPIGYSVGHPDITAGTLGARVTDGTNVYILSNNHVLAAGNDAQIGDPTLQPGAYDGGTDPEDIIGYLDDFEPLRFDGSPNDMDAAISIVNPDDVSGSTPADEGYGAPGTTVTEASLGMAVQKYGRTTGHTRGQVSETNVTVAVCYLVRGPWCFEAATFTGQIAITDGSFSAGGDSGSLIVTDDGANDPVGLLFAGSDTRTIANPIGPVLDRFNVTIDPTVPEGSGDSNLAPTASFSFSCTDLSCEFDGSVSSDSDGSITSYDWDFGDGATATGVTTSHAFAAGGTYTVTLTVTDDDGATGSHDTAVTVTESSSGDFSLSVSAYKVRGLQKADLEWAGATSADVDVLRDGVVIETTTNDGFHTDDIDQRGSGNYVYQVCEAGTSTCSNEAVGAF